MKYRGIICEKCGVEVTLSKVRRERMGHIELASPVAHIWFLKSLPSRIGLLLDMTLKDLERVLYFENYVVHRAGPDAAEAASAAERGAVPQRAGRVRRGRVHRRHRRRGAEADAGRHRPGRASATQLRAELKETTSEAKRKKLVKRLKLIEAFIEFGAASGMDDPRRRPGDPARAAPAGAAGRRPLRDLGPERPLSPRHQPQQPPEAADRAARARHHRAQREAHAAGGGGRAVRQRPPRPRHHRRQQAAAEVAVRHAEGQAGPLPPEPARQARRLFRPFGHRRRSGAEAAPVRPAEEDGARAVQAVHLLEARAVRPSPPPSRPPSAWSRRSGPRCGTSSKR